MGEGQRRGRDSQAGSPLSTEPSRGSIPRPQEHDLGQNQGSDASLMAPPRRPAKPLSDSGIAHVLWLLFSWAGLDFGRRVSRMNRKLSSYKRFGPKPPPATGVGGLSCPRQGRLSRLEAGRGKGVSLAPLHPRAQTHTLAAFLKLGQNKACTSSH